MFSKRHLSSFFIGLVLAVILLSAHESKAISLGVRSLDNFEAPSTVASRSHLAARQDEGDDDSGGDDDDDDDNTPTTAGEIGYGEGEEPQQGDTPSCSDPSDLDGDCDSDSNSPQGDDEPSTVTTTPVVTTTISYTSETGQNFANSADHSVFASYLKVWSILASLLLAGVLTALL